MSHGITISALAKRTQCQAETIRYYEREGLLPPPARSQGNYRQNEATHVERLSFIRHCGSLDMTLDEIRALQDFRDAPTRNCAQVSPRRTLRHPQRDVARRQGRQPGRSCGTCPRLTWPTRALDRNCLR